MKAILCAAVSVVMLGACAPSGASSPSSAGGMKIFNTEAEAMQALREGKLKQGEKFAVRQ